MDNLYMVTNNYKKLVFLHIVIFLLLVNISGCSDGLTGLERIKQRGQLRVAILTAPPVFFPDESVLRGLDYKIITEYADSINVKLEPITARTLGEMLTLLKQGKAHIAITNSTPMPVGQTFHSSTPYNPNQWYVIGNRNNRLPKNIEDISSDKLVVAQDSGPALVMEKLEKRYPSLRWTELPKGDFRHILEQVSLNRFKLTVINADTFAYYRQLYPELKIAFKLDARYPSRWLTYRQQHQGLLKSINAFIYGYVKSGKLDKLRSTYFRHLQVFRYVDNVYFLRRIETLLPKFQPLFAEAAKQYGFDERFLAAVSYQESNWDVAARSMTGVRGLMMLTQQTAKRVGVTNRLDPKQSIFGGANYLNILRESLPQDILEPDRSWMALAAYNVGLGHLEDARILTEKAGGNPHLWIDVEKHLPKLSEKKWYKHTRYGYARGHEPVAFVRRIHIYFDILRLYQQETLLKGFYTPIEYGNLRLNSPVI